MSDVQVHAQQTPNPNSMKFNLDRKLVTGGSVSFSSAADAQGTAWAQEVFRVPGVAAIFAMNDFVTVTRQPGVEWAGIVDGVEKALKTALE